MKRFQDRIQSAKDQGAENRASQAAADEARRQRDANPAERWEYKVIRIRTGAKEGLLGAGSVERKLNAWGALGWEFAFITENRIVFKRQVTQISQAELADLSEETDADEI